LPQFFLVSLSHVPLDPQHPRFDASPEASPRVAGLCGRLPARRSVEVRMDSVVNQLARELTDAIAAAVADDARVEACREKARAAGLEVKVSLEAVIGFVNRANGTPAKGTPRKLTSRSSLEMSANDRRFLKSLRISADEPTTEKEVE
jgi:hypothetical protein